MKLTDDEVQAALYCVVEVVDRRRRANIPVPPWMIQLARRLNLTSALSDRGHELDSGGEQSEPERLIGTREAAAILGFSPRHVRRIAGDLDGETISGRVLFSLSTVAEYAQEKTDGRHRRSV
ncbi:helix-turn-helix domain-containing protein [Mycolicibacterium wolinskyi]|uniref:helix-turn-helix domain-containing protein n=1 Tax=Mycolicibacterium TaxID=1866885 RepID=UPI0010557114|nr:MULTISPECIES: helix-turn-helix domain-containing protein [Mycolicibacterium]MCV7285353.1 helix-turn-helix domain-containing protein [Mycolicibacterium wolinskyi]MCV7295144.1 helix-turn-helix domain-containing protein [Mycolicibacterium goodii]